MSLIPDENSDKDIFLFVSQIKCAYLTGKSLVSYDALSLFTNVPARENIEIAINLILNNNTNLNITKKNLKTIANNNIRSVILEIKNDRCKIVKILIFRSLS